MSTNSLIGINLLNSSLLYQNPVDIYQTLSTQNNGGPCNTHCNRMCNTNLASNNPASQYQRQKLIQNTVRVQSSLYTMNLAGLSGYQKPLNQPQLVEQAGTPYIAPAKVYWNQMSDRAKPSNQVQKVASGSTYHTSSTRHTITRDRPGAMSPGGVGVDIKHNSYDRYLNKLKGKAPLRRGIVPLNYGSSIEFNRSNPVYGGKVMKTSIINGCDCPELYDDKEADIRIYGSDSNAIQDNIISVKYVYNIGDYVWAKKYDTIDLYYKGQIIDINNALYTIKFEDNDIKSSDYCDLIAYFDCNCNPELSLQELAVSNEFNQLTLGEQFAAENNIYCNLLNILTTTEGII